ncbi:MAG: hypothetical protein A2152_04195 [Candidatus Levybacteria bacterium RBG_16_35_6]|uniref:Queuosine 5'-phosphate N-glycosylase/hydrolase n=1 Tax=Candidatus Woesebacteria bacterium RBG_13_36_22 TaxID=1802478 RepID=A0A1F7X0J1_9BACT|nr:MAG: hypothetical protein A2152_04195 [Candidatus Levybacteria bacterium RBG_16_35_6]OGM08517.1 MAG: hypothetical protein A2Z67_02185 [Candidatus Woesebacteria bacterium RBG_13_36_22]
MKSNDNLGVLETTKYVVRHAKSVSLHKRKIGKIIPKVRKRLEAGLEDPVMGFGAQGNFENDAQLIFLEDVVNFCFWAEKNKPKWEIEFPKGTIIKGGAYAMVGSFKRALVEQVPILDANFLANLTPEQSGSLFRSCNGIDMPLLDKRLENLREAGKVLNEKFSGKFSNAIKLAEYDAVKLVQLIYQNFFSFADIAKFEGRNIYFLKRAQICVNDISYLTNSPHKITGLENLTAFADYKLPQMLREAEIIEYTPELSEKVDNMVLIKAGSSEEVEIRAATVWGVELIHQKMKRYTPAQIDNALWLISQDQSNVRPYHRTYTIYY